jgi:hypothetical protein
MCAWTGNINYRPPCDICGRSRIAYDVERASLAPSDVPLGQTKQRAVLGDEVRNVLQAQPTRALDRQGLEDADTATENLVTVARSGVFQPVPGLEGGHNQTPGYHKRVDRIPQFLCQHDVRVLISRRAKRDFS